MFFYIVTMPCEGTLAEFNAAAKARSAAQGAAEDSVPHIAWGRYVRNGERLELGISVEVNHRLIDGVHIGRFAEKLTERINGLE